MERYLVTGASGFIGRHVCSILRQQGLAVSALVRSDDRNLRLLGVEVLIGDVLEPDSWAPGLVNVDYVIHCAADARFGNGPHYHRANTLSTSVLIEAIKRSLPGLRRLVFVSTVGAVDRSPADKCHQPLSEISPPHPTSDYGRSKRAAEELVRTSGIPYSIVRPAMVIGREMRFDSHLAAFIRWGLTGTWKSKLGWTGGFSAVAVEDLASALILCARHPEALNETFFCGAEDTSILHCLEIANPKGLRISLAIPAKLAALLPSFCPFTLKAALLPALTVSASKLRALGWLPRRKVNDVLAEVAERERSRLDPQLDPGGQTVITGAASGLGYAIFEQLVRHRRNILLVDRDKAQLEKLISQNPNCRAVVVDLSSEAEIYSLVESAAWLGQDITELYAVAGIGRRGTVSNLLLRDQLDTIKVNLSARLMLTHAASQTMRRNNFGRILLVSSSSAFQPLPFMSVYAATNSALLSLGEAWSAELDHTGVHILVACPGGMQTAFQRQGGVKTISKEKLMSPATVAHAIFDGFARQKTTLLISFRCVAMSLLARVAPRRLLVSLWKHLMASYR